MLNIKTYNDFQRPNTPHIVAFTLNIVTYHQITYVSNLAFTVEAIYIRMYIKIRFNETDDA